MRAFIGLGSNIGNRLANLRRAVSELEAALGPGRVSPLYESPPALRAEQGFFWNAVFEGWYGGEPEELLRLLKGLERRLGREERVPNAPRPVDLDLLLLGELRWRSAVLELPHPRLIDRDFVLLPLFDLAPEILLPSGSLAEALLALGGVTGARPLAGPGWIRQNFFCGQEENKRRRRILTHISEQFRNRIYSIPGKEEERWMFRSTSSGTSTARPGR